MEMDIFDIKGKVAIVTGGTGTLGGSISRCLARAGARVVVLGRNKDAMARQVDDLRAAGREAMGVTADVTDMRQLESTREEIIAQWGRIDILVNTAGGNTPGATVSDDSNIFELDVEEFRKNVDLNLNGTVFPSLVFGKAMAETGSGSIINLSSMATYSAISRVPAYSVAKSGVEIFTKWLAMELASKFSEKIRVNCIAPGFFIGNQNRQALLNPDGSYTERSLKVLAKTPMKRFGRIEELNGTVLYLCSEAASFVTGTVIPVDGGFSSSSGV